MKKIIIISGMLIGFAQYNTLIAQDDVYDAPRPKEVRIKRTNTQPAKQTEIVRQSEQTVPYYDEDNNSSRMQLNAQSNVRNGQYDDQSNYSDDYFVSGFGYTDRIRRFHNNSFGFNYGYNNWNNNFNDPYYSYNNFNSWNNYAFTPSWTYGYSNFYNPFCSNNQIIIFQPGFSSWYNTGFCNTGFSNFGNNYGWNNFGSYGFSPFCSNMINNYGFPSNYGGYYDSNRKNVVYAPRTYGYGNSNLNGTTNPNNNNSGGWNVNNNNTNTNYNNTNTNNQGTKTTKWSNSNNNNNSQQKPGNWSNPYKNNTTPVNTTTPANNNNGWNNSNNNSNTTTPRPGDGSGGIKIGTKPK